MDNRYLFEEPNFRNFILWDRISNFIQDSRNLYHYCEAKFGKEGLDFFKSPMKPDENLVEHCRNYIINYWIHPLNKAYANALEINSNHNINCPQMPLKCISLHSAIDEYVKYMNSFIQAFGVFIADNRLKLDMFLTIEPCVDILISVTDMILSNLRAVKCQYFYEFEILDMFAEVIVKSTTDLTESRKHCTCSKHYKLIESANLIRNHIRTMRQENENVVIPLIRDSSCSKVLTYEPTVDKDGQPSIKQVLHTVSMDDGVVMLVAKARLFNKEGLEQFMSSLFANGIVPEDTNETVVLSKIEGINKTIFNLNRYYNEKKKEDHLKLFCKDALKWRGYRYD